MTDWMEPRCGRCGGGLERADWLCAGCRREDEVWADYAESFADPDGRGGGGHGMKTCNCGGGQVTRVGPGRYVCSFCGEPTKRESSGR